MGIFDPVQIQNETIRERYERALRRGVTIGETMAASFPRRDPVRLFFSTEESFNAYADKDEVGYILEVCKPVPLFLLILFEKLLGDARLFPWLGATGELVSDYELDFIFDPADFSRRGKWQIALTKSRSFMAGILADIACAFVQMHELGHVMCGHVEANRLLTGRHAMAEMVEKAPTAKKDLERERAWEADADSVAASFMVQYLAELVEQARIQPRAIEAFGRGDYTVEHILSITVVSLFAMFAYFRGTRYQLARQSSHPHPFVRSFYVKDMLITAARREWPIDRDVLGTLIDDRLDEMIEALEVAGLFEAANIDDRYLDRTEREVARIIKQRTIHRDSCIPWAWFDWTKA